jgi:hypothetical protein
VDFPLTFPGEILDVVAEAYANARTILEYGSGGSTFLALNSGVYYVATVESDPEFSARLAAALGALYPADRFAVHHVDIGPTKRWGFPAGRTALGAFHRYATTVWTRPDFQPPEVVLVDGRFRAACAMTTLLMTEAPVRLLFDDYFSRPQYHWIEAHMQPVDRVDRMAIFDLEPTPLPRGALVEILAAYQDPR